MHLKLGCRTYSSSDVDELPASLTCLGLMGVGPTTSGRADSHPWLTGFKMEIDRTSLNILPTSSFQKKKLGYCNHKEASLLSFLTMQEAKIPKEKADCAESPGNAF